MKTLRDCQSCLADDDIGTRLEKSSSRSLCFLALLALIGVGDAPPRGRNLRLRGDGGQFAASTFVSIDGIPTASANCCAECLSCRKRIDDDPASKLTSARDFFEATAEVLPTPTGAASSSSTGARGERR
jgi:hypothetical protein